MKGWMYILECADGSYYTGSTNDLNKRLWEHNNFLGANYTRKKHPVKLVYSEEYNRIDDAFYREKQVQGWSHAKKKALIEQRTDMLHGLAECRNDSHCCNNPDASAPLNNPVASAPLSDRVGKDMPNKNRSSSGAETTDAKEKL
jgi:putative endonuclease